MSSMSSKGFFIVYYRFFPLSFMFEKRIPRISFPMGYRMKKRKISLISPLALLAILPICAYYQVAFFQGYESKSDALFTQKLSQALNADGQVLVASLVQGSWKYACLVPVNRKVLEIDSAALDNALDYEIDRFDININEKYKKLAFFDLSNKKVAFFNIATSKLDIRKKSMIHA